MYVTKSVSLSYSVNTLTSRSTAEALTQLRFHAVSIDARQSLAAVTQNIVHVGEIDSVAIRVSHADVHWGVVWATCAAFSKQTVTRSDAVRTSTFYVRENFGSWKRRVYIFSNLINYDINTHPEHSILWLHTHRCSHIRSTKVGDLR
jgi:hypothetical protein